MASCEKCWSDAGIMGGDKTENYANLIEERKDDPCTPEEQAGHDAEICPKCKRKTVHQLTHECVVCGLKQS